MFSPEKLGLLAFLNDNARVAVNRGLQALSSQLVDKALDASRFIEHTDQTTDVQQICRLIGDITRNEAAVERTIEIIQSYLRNEIRVITFWDDGYPEDLRTIQNPPLILYIRGSTFPGRKPVAIVGTRHPSEKGLSLAYEYGSRLAEWGCTIVSGLAKGIDAQAHRGCLTSSGTTIAILGTPPTQIYPEENKGLAEEILVNGSLVSEITDEAYMHPGRFVQRNRITSGISGSVVVIESIGEGGTYRQVELALKQGRRVYVVEQEAYSNPDHKFGFKKLTDMGAMPVSDPSEISFTGPKQKKLF